MLSPSVRAQLQWVSRRYRQAERDRASGGMNAAEVRNSVKCLMRLTLQCRFSGECRPQAERLSKLLVERGARVFYDNFYLGYLLGKRLDEEFSSVFGKMTRYFIPLVSKSYAMKAWPQYEWGHSKIGVGAERTRVYSAVASR